jgi:prolyl-tRNA editing enzyme YbaK/EbsC (Cys-tRNA(Pro) deacylase)
MTLPETSQRVIAAGARLGVVVDMHHFPEGTKTSQDAANAIGCELSAIAKSIVLTLDDHEPVVVFASGDTRIDLERLASATGATRARRATLEEARVATGFAAGGTPPFGYPQPLRVFADRALRRHDVVWAAGGTPTTVFPIALEELVRAAGAQWVEVAQGNS